MSAFLQDPQIAAQYPLAWRARVNVMVKGWKCAEQIREAVVNAIADCGTSAVQRLLAAV